MNDKGWTALMCAVKSNAIDIARLLVTKKADVNVQPVNNYINPDVEK